MAKIVHNAKAHVKYSLWVKNYKCQKRAKNDSTTTLELMCAKNGSNKQLIFEKWEHFENGQNWPQCKGPCKILTLGQKLQIPKTCEKQLHYHNRVVVCKKRLEKTPNSRKMRAFWKWPKLATMQKLWPMQKKTLSLGQKITFLKTCEKRLYKHIRVALCKKRLEKTANNRKLRAFWKWTKLATMQRL